VAIKVGSRLAVDILTVVRMNWPLTQVLMAWKYGEETAVSGDALAQAKKDGLAKPRN
jgi:hypothetical protein